MSQPQWRQEDGWTESDPALAAHSVPEGIGAYAPPAELEPGWRALRALMQLRSDELLSITLRPSFRPVRDLDLVTVMPCAHCRDGGMRTAGTVRICKKRVTVCACDTCGAVEVGEQPSVLH